MSKYIIIFCFALGLSCTNNSKKEVVKTPQNNQKKEITKELIAKLKFDDILLDKSANTYIENWKAYTTINQAILDIKNLNFKFFTKEQDLFLSTVLELKTTIPEDINTQPIKARILVVQNQLYRFQEELKIKKQLYKEDLIFIKELFVSFSNLNLQINKKIEKEAQVVIKPQ